jgi:hypothetical protein
MITKKNYICKYLPLIIPSLWSMRYGMFLVFMYTYIYIYIHRGIIHSHIPIHVGKYMDIYGYVPFPILWSMRYGMFLTLRSDCISRILTHSNICTFMFTYILIHAYLCKYLPLIIPSLWSMR